jgi:TRAP-type transport system periplasmic protein
MAESPTTATQKELSLVVLFSGSRDDRTAEVHPIQQAASSFAEAVERRTNREITVNIHVVNTLYTQQEILEKVALGIVDMGMATQGALDRYVNLFALVMLPFLYDGYNHAYKVLDGPFKDWVTPLLEQRNLIYLANWEWGFRNITNNVRPVRVPEDVKGLRLRTPPGEKELRLTMEACGATVTELELVDVYTALEQGTLDGQENPVEVFYRFGFYNVQKYLSLTKHVYNCMVHVMSLKTWRKLTPDQQRVIGEESQKAGNAVRQAVQAEERMLLAKIKSQGVEVGTSPDIEAFRALMPPAYRHTEHDVGKERMNTFLEMVERHRQ